jgi:glucokinase
MGSQHTAVGAVDIGGTKIAAGVVDAAGKLLAKEVHTTDVAGGFDAAMVLVAAMLESARARADVKLSGIGIGCTGPVDAMTGELGSVEFLADWRGCNPVKQLSRHFGLTVAMENDADAAALGEWQWGAGRGKRHVICVTVGTGIGAGIVLNQTLYRGVDGAHPEIGHHTIQASGPKCYCGSHGCWEVLARGPAMAARVLQEAPPDYPHRDRLTAHDVCELARRGDLIAQREIEREGNYLGVGVANLVTMYAPEVIALSGSVMNAADLFMPTIHAIVQRSCGLVPAASVNLLPAALGNDAPLIGAAAVWHHRFGKS